MAHDGEVALAGITTVFDAIRVGSLRGRGQSVQYLRYARDLADAIKQLKDRNVLRVDHWLHLRSEVCSETVLEELDEFRGEALVGIVSIMDHTPGQRQFTDMARHREFYRIRHAMSDHELESYVAHTQGLHARHGAEHEQGIVELARGLGAVLASHDDTTVEHVARSVELGIGFAEFPTTLEAARACRAAGVPVMMGAPNILQGGSHTGNVAAMDLAEQGLLDILSSDYAPSALLMGAMKLGRASGDLPGAVAMVTGNPARAVGLADRGEIAVGKRADLLTLREIDGLSVVTGVWSAGRKVG